MTATLGVLRDTRLTCAEAGYHLPGCYSPPLDHTWCICGDEQWAGNTGVWQCVEKVRPASVEIPRGVGMGATGYVHPVGVVGWDTYWFEYDTHWRDA